MDKLQNPQCGQIKIMKSTQVDKLELSSPHKWTSLLLSLQVDKLQNLQCGQIKIMKSTQVDSLLLSSQTEKFITKSKKWMN